MKMANILKGIPYSLLVCVLLSQAAFAQQEAGVDRNELNGLLDPNPDQFYCQEFFQGVPGCSESEACEIAVCGIDPYCCDDQPGVTGQWDNICISEAQSFTECQREESSEAIARFKVDKYFDDGNPAEVEVTITCNTGLPLQQSDDISEGDGVTFVVTDFNDGEMDCEIVETAPEGYSEFYASAIIFLGEDGCQFTGVNYGLSYDCDVYNSLESVTVDVTKEWIDENPKFNAVNYAEANYGCSGAQFYNPYGNLTFFGNPGSDSFYVYPHWNGNTTCWVTESFVDSGIETDDSDCASVSVTIGSDPECTIVNTRLYEGIPTLSQYGLILLAMLMLGVGFVAYRRLV